MNKYRFFNALQQIEKESQQEAINEQNSFEASLAAEVGAPLVGFGPAGKDGQDGKNGPTGPAGLEEQEN